MSSKISGFITSKFTEIQARVPITLSGFSNAEDSSFQKRLAESLDAIENTSSENDKTAPSIDSDTQSSAVDFSMPVVFPNILPAPTPEPEPEHTQEYDGDDYYNDDFYNDYYGVNNNDYGNYGNYNNNSDYPDYNVGFGNEFDNDIAKLNRYGDAEIQAMIQEEILLASTRYGVDEYLIKAVIMQESGFSPTSISSAGAQGLMQLMPETCQWLGVTNPWDISQNIDGGTRLIKKYLEDYDGNLKLTLAAYNAGPGAVRTYGGVPPYEETQNYVQKVIAYYNKYHNESPSLYDASII